MEDDDDDDQDEQEAIISPCIFNWTMTRLEGEEEEEEEGDNVDGSSGLIIFSPAGITFLGLISQGTDSSLLLGGKLITPSM